MKKAFLWIGATGVIAVAVGVAYWVGREAGREERGPNYSMIEPGFYLGGQCAAPPAGVKAVLNLSQQREGYGAEVYAWEGIVDGEPLPTLGWLRERVLFIDAQRKAGREVFVHCDAGLSRSGMVGAAYLMWRDHLGREEALAVLRKARPGVRPNAAFKGLLGEWEKELKGKAGTRAPQG